MHKNSSLARQPESWVSGPRLPAESIDDGVHLAAAFDVERGHEVVADQAEPGHLGPGEGLAGIGVENPRSRQLLFTVSATGLRC